ncbi:restriction endonuclease subunit S [uncultured Methanobrevibacter sp.]|uniref:restriction endonuclease subunit S n=1 Tax=uncultured Methanobrevibacter sp. TaxID=253161 RepID=UPI0025D9E1CA|nr:restriction endonuclease subunit S [uncultured Methanobrevibacter sp.]
MKNSELGLIPNDWDIGILGDYIKIERGLSYKGKYLSDEGIPLINLGNILPNSKFRLEKLKFYSGDFDEKYVVNAGDIVANTDLTQDRLVLGSPIIVPSLIDNDVIIYSHHINRLSQFKLPKFYIFYNLLSERYNHMVSGYATGTTVLAISKESLYDYRIIIPPKELLFQFEEIATNIEKIKDNNLLEIEKLTKLRDTLLPKLMSGEIDVSKINCDLE